MATANPEFRFIEEPRGYWVGGNRLLSVTEIIKDNGFSNLEWTTQTALIRGRIVHSITAGLDRGLTFSWSDLHVDLHGYVRSWTSFRDSMCPEFLPIEAPLFHPKLLYAGTPDRIVKIRGNEMVWDIKTGPSEPWHGYQSAAYGSMLPWIENERRRFGIHLQADGSKAIMKEHADFTDFSVFSAMLLCTRKRRIHGIESLNIENSEININQNGGIENVI